MRKTDSLPISRVPSSIRLSSPSFPPTPHAPPSQLGNVNPASTLSISNTPLPSNPEDETFDNLKIVQAINKFESQLSLLSQKVTSFDSNELDVVISQIIETNQELTQEINKLESHKSLQLLINNLDDEKHELDVKSKGILKKLIGFRSELKQLPSLPTTGELNEFNEINIDEVLKYGMKLSKFTKAPASNIGAHPNNFIWPAEDSLRRGMLAMSSLKGDEIIKHELGIIEPSEPKQIDNKDLDNHESNSKPTLTDNPSDNLYKPQHTQVPAAQEKKEEKKKESPALDLDLFDPEYDSD